MWRDKDVYSVSSAARDPGTAALFLPVLRTFTGGAADSSIDALRLLFFAEQMKLERCKQRARTPENKDAYSGGWLGRTLLQSS
jgi:hypothetical protein